MPKKPKKDFVIIDYGVMEIHCKARDVATITAIWKKVGLEPIKKPKIK